eukprot:jgi/Bigna1/66449/fgenesh1_pg.1_\
MPTAKARRRILVAAALVYATIGLFHLIDPSPERISIGPTSNEAGCHSKAEDDGDVSDLRFDDFPEELDNDAGFKAFVPRGVTAQGEPTIREQYGLPESAGVEELEQAGRDRPYGPPYCGETDVEEVSVETDDGVPGKKLFFKYLRKEIKEGQKHPEKAKYQKGWVVDTICGAGDFAGYGNGDCDGPANRARFRSPSDVAIVPVERGGVVIAEVLGNRVRHLTSNGVVTTLAGSTKAEFGYRDGPCSVALFDRPTHIAADRNGNVYVTDRGNEVIRKISEGIVTTVVGANSYRGTKPVFEKDKISPAGIYCDRNNNLIFVDKISHTVKCLRPDGLITLIAGNHIAGAADGPLGSFNLFGEFLLRLDFFRDFASLNGRCFFPGENMLRNPNAITMDTKDNIYVTSEPEHELMFPLYGHLIKKISPNGVASTLPYSLQQKLLWPAGLASANDAVGSVFVSSLHSIRRVLPARKRKVPWYVVGTSNGTNEYRPEATTATLHQKMDPETREEMMPLGQARIYDVAGEPTSWGLTQGRGVSARFWHPSGICRSPDGAIYVADADNNRIRRLRRLVAAT